MVAPASPKIRYHTFQPIKLQREKIDLALQHRAETKESRLIFTESTVVHEMICCHIICALKGVLKGVEVTKADHTTSTSS